MSRKLDSLPVETEATGNDLWLVTGELGQMVNLSKGRALGGTAYLAIDDRGSRFGLKARGRQWISREIAADLGVGLLLAGTDNTYEPSFPAFTGHVGLMYRDLVGATVRMEAISGDPKPEISAAPIGTDVAWYAGVTSGSHLAVASAVAAFVLFVIASGAT